MHRNPARPLSPHLSIWRWGPHMAVSILHRMTGAGLATFGLAMLVWWLIAAANGPASYDYFTSWAAWRWSLIFWVPLTWAFWMKTLAGLRHLVMDIGAGFELRTNRSWSVLIMIMSLLLTAATWAAIVVWKLPA
jgi:succinate dehydrogenase / fumarate reductase cytochrome b subunit